MDSFTKWKYTIYTTIILVILEKFKLQQFSKYVIFTLILRLVMEYDI